METARREVREETNYEVDSRGVLHVRELYIDYGPPAPVWVPMVKSIVVYTARPVSGRLAVPAHRFRRRSPKSRTHGGSRSTNSPRVWWTESEFVRIWR